MVIFVQMPVLCYINLVIYLYLVTSEKETQYVTVIKGKSLKIPLKIMWSLQSESCM